MKAPLPFILPSLMVWATTCTAMAQDLVPMVRPTTQAQPVLMPLNAKPETAAAGDLAPMQRMADSEMSNLQPMAGPPATKAVNLAPMVVATDPDVSLSPLNRKGEPEVMRGRSDGIRGPVPALAPIAPPLVVKPPAAKPVVLPKTGKPTRTVAPANAGNVAESAKGVGVTDFRASNSPLDGPGLNEFTDNELSPDPSLPTVSRPDEQLVIADITLNGIRRSTLLSFYQDDHQTLWLPLTALAQLLEIPLKVNAGAGVAQGWYMTPDNKVLLHMGEGKAQIGPKTFDMGLDVEKHASDLYISHKALKAWFGVESKLDYNELRLTLTTPQPLPGDLHAARMETWEKTDKSRRKEALPTDTFIPPYATFSQPVIRLGANTTLLHPSEGSAAMTTGLTLQSENDLFGMNSNIALSFSQQTGDSTGRDSGLTGGSVLLQKRSEAADLLGPLRATYFGLGDITTNPIPLSGQSSRGRGVNVNSLPQGAVTNPDQYILTGPAPINWDVEVYQNATLVAYSRIDSSGTYRFTALPLKAGRNNFRIVLYGPSGEKEERRETLYLAGNVPDRGEIQYDTSVFQPNRTLIPGLPNQSSSTAVTAQTQFIAGLGRHWAATLGAFQSMGNMESGRLNKPEEKGVSTGVRGSVGGSYLTADALAAGKGNALQGTLRTPLTSTVDLRLAETRNFQFSTDERDELSQSQAEITVPFSVGRALLDTAYGYTRTTYQNQQQKQGYTQRTAVAMGPLNATNQLEYSTQGTSSQLNGTLESTVHVFKTSWRTGLTYQPDSTDVLRSYYVNTQLPVTDRKTVNMTYTQQLTDNKTANLAGSMYWNNGPFSWGLQAQAATDGNMQVGLNMTTALVPDGYREARWKLAPPAATIGQGQAAVRVYADANDNNQYDEGEALLSNVTVYNRLRGSQQKTNTQGLALFTDLTPSTLARLEIDLTTLPDIYLKPVSDTLNVKPHAGDNGVLNYAVRLYGEVSGQVFTAQNAPVQNLTLTLHDAKTHNKVDSFQTDSDGFYTFGALPLGAYTLETGLPDTPPTPVTIGAKTRVQTLNLTVTPPLNVSKKGA